MTKNLVCIVALVFLLAGSSAYAQLQCVIVNLTISDTITGTDTTCYGSCSGYASVVVFGGTGPYQVEFRDTSHVTLPGGLGNQVDSLCAGPYLVYIKDIGENCDTIIPFEVHSYPPFVLSTSNDTTVCSSTQASLSVQATGGGGGTHIYTWNPTVGVGPTATTFPTVTTNHTITVEDGKGCKAGPENILVTVPDSIVVTVTPDTAFIVQGDSAYFFAGVTGGLPPFNYTWSGGAGSTQGVWVSPLFDDTYFVFVSDICQQANGKGVLVYVDPTGLDEPEIWIEEDILLYPNPAQQAINIKRLREFDQSAMQVNIVDATGRVLYEELMHSQSNARIDISSWPQGLYHCIMEWGNKRVSRGFIKQ